jgi:RNA polymerase sigma-70 factor (family 1)
LFLYVFKLVKDEEKAKDIVQECFLRLWENREKVDLSKDLLPLLVTYIRNLLIDDFRKTQRYEQALQSLQHKTIHSFTSPEIEQQLELRDRERQLSGTLSSLPIKRQTIFRLIRQEGLSYQEVAEQLNLSLPDVKKQMRLSLQALRKIMQLFICFDCCIFLLA